MNICPGFYSNIMLSGIWTWETFQCQGGWAQISQRTERNWAQQKPRYGWNRDLQIQESSGCHWSFHTPGHCYCWARDAGSSLVCSGPEVHTYHRWEQSNQSFQYRPWYRRGNGSCQKIPYIRSRIWRRWLDGWHCVDNLRVQFSFSV